MPKITIFNPRGEKEAEGEVPAGLSLLEASGKVGAHHGSACGGVCACSTCHVWVKKGLASLGDQSSCEEDYLDRAYDVRAYSHRVPKASMEEITAHRPAEPVACLEKIAILAVPGGVLYAREQYPVTIEATVLRIVFEQA